MFLKARLLIIRIGPSVRLSVPVSSFRSFRHVRIVDFKLGMVIPVIVGYDLESVITLESLPDFLSCCKR